MRRLALILTLAVCTVQAAGFSGNSQWGVVETDAYRAEIFRNGSFVFAPKDAPRITCSFIRSWVAWQRFPQISMMEAEQDGDASFRFCYFWDGGRVEEILCFDARSVTATYAYTPLETRSTQFVRCLLTPEKPPADLRLVATETHDELSTLTAPDGKGSRFLALTTRGAGDQELDFAALAGRWSIERFPVIMLSNNQRGGKWIGEREAGDTLHMSYRLLLSNADGATLPDSPIAFHVSSGQ